MKSAAGKELQVCSCGWSKVTSGLGLKIHQERMKCLKEASPGPRIDQYLLRERSSKASEAQRQDLTRSPPSISTPEAERNSSTASENLEPSQLQPALEKNIRGHRPQVKWPKSSSKKEWATIDTDLSNILDELRGTVVKKLERMGDLIYSYGTERFGTKHPRKTETSSALREKGIEETMEKILTGGESGHRPPASGSEGTSGKAAKSRKARNPT